MLLSAPLFGPRVGGLPGLRWTHVPRSGSTSLWPVLPPPAATTCTQALTLSRSAPFHRDGLKAAPKSQKADSPSIDYAELLQHFERVQKKHLEVRHQRSGRGDHLDRRVVL